MADLNYNHLRYFWAVACDGNLTRTAERLNVSQSALSVQIRKLEQRLGHALFERRGRQLHLTEAGRIALSHAEAIFATGDELISTMKETGRARQAVRIGALATLSRNFQIGFIQPLLARNDIEIILRSGSAAELFHGLETLALDVVLTNHPLNSDHLTPFIAHKLAEQNVSLVGAPQLAAPEAALPQLLARHPIIVPTIGNSMRTAFDALVDRLGVRPQIAAEVDDMAMMRLLVRQGFAFGVLPPIVVRDELAQGTLVEASALPDSVEQFFAITTKRRFPNTIVGDLIGSAKI